jgi:hypothetical protein
LEVEDLEQRVCELEAQAQLKETRQP